MANEKAEPAGGERALEPSFLNALPHFLPLAVFPLVSRRIATGVMVPVVEAGGLAGAVLGELASREAAPGAGIDILFVHDGGEPAWHESLCREFAGALRALSEGSLVFAPGLNERPVRSLARFEELRDDAGASGELLELIRARCIFTAGDPTVGVSFDAARRAILAEGAARDALIADLRKPATDAPAPGLAAIDDMRGGLRDIERCARLLQLTQGGDSRSPAATVFEKAGADGTIPGDTAERLAEAARLWRTLQGALGLAVEDAGAADIGPDAGAFLARSCEAENVDTLGEAATRAVADIGALEGERSPLTETDGNPETSETAGATFEEVWQRIGEHAG